MATNDTNQPTSLIWVQGNKLQLALPLQIVTFTDDGKTEEDYNPPTGSTILVCLAGKFRCFRYTPTISDGNVLHIVDNGELPADSYSVTIIVEEPNGTKRRCKWNYVINVYDSNEKVTDYFDDFPDWGSGAILEGSVFYSTGSGGYEPPVGGIPKSDLASDVQASLTKADTAIQDISGKQDVLVSGTNIKTINNQSLLGSGNITIEGGGAVDSVNGKTGVVVLDAEDVGAAPQSTTYTKTEVDAALAVKQNTLVSGTNIATINGSDITQGGNVTIVAEEGQTITIDATPTRGSNNAVSSGGTFTALEISQDYDLTQYTLRDYSLGTTNWWINGSAGRHKLIPVFAGEKFHIVATPSGSATVGFIGWLTLEYTQPTSTTQKVPYVSGTTRIEVTDGDYIAPVGAAYLCIVPVDGSGNQIEWAVSRVQSCKDILLKNDALELLTEYDLTQIQLRNYSLGKPTWWINGENGKHKVIPVAEGDKFYISATLSGAATAGFIGWLTSSYSQPTSISQNVPYVSGTTRIEVKDAGYYEAPSGASYLCIVPVDGGGNQISWSVAKVQEFEDKIHDDDIAPTQGSVQYVTSGGIYKAIANKIDRYDILQRYDLVSKVDRNCSLGSSTWYHSGVKGYHKYIPVTAGHLYHIPVDDSWLGWLTSSYSTGTEPSNGQTIPFVSGTTRFQSKTNESYYAPEGAAYLAVSTVDGAGNIYNIPYVDDISASSLLYRLDNIERETSSMSNPKLRIAHWNIGHFCLGTGYNTTITHAEYEEMQHKWATRINEINADIFMCAEYNTNFVDAADGESAITAREAVFVPQIYHNAYIGVKQNYFMVAIFSNKTINGVTEVTFPNATQNRKYMVGTMELNSKQVKIVETHLDWNEGTTGQANRLLQIQKLIADFSQDEYVIIAADFNTNDATEMGAFVNAGYTMANLGYLGELKTYPAGNEPESGIDNIICKGFTCNGVNVVNDAELSDHCCIYADFTLVS